MVVSPYSRIAGSTTVAPKAVAMKSLCVGGHSLQEVNLGAILLIGFLAMALSLVSCCVLLVIIILSHKEDVY
jgi:uncharacterized membrane protein YphA (DoxX/SURF4 family)